MTLDGNEFHADSRGRVRSSANRDQVRNRAVCEHCGTTIGPFEVHHIVRKSKGGGDTIENMACLCGFSPVRMVEGNAEGCHRRHHRGAIKFKRSPDFVPPEYIDTEFDSIWSKYLEDIGGDAED